MTQATQRPYQNQYRVEDDNEDETANQVVDPALAATPEPDPVTPEDKHYKPRYDSLKAHYDKMIVQARQREQELLEQIKKSSDKFELPESKEDLEQWRKEFPDLYKIVRMISRLEADERTKEIDQKVEILAKEQLVVSRDKAENVLIRLHPDFPQLRTSQEFRDWLDSQDPTIQGWLYSGDDPHLAAKAITMYKAEKVLENVKKKPARNSAVDASLAVTKTKPGDSADTVQPKQWRMSDVDKLSPRQFEKFEAEIEAAMKEGRMIYDA